MLTWFIIRNLGTITIYTESSFQEKGLQKCDENSYSNFDIHAFFYEQHFYTQSQAKIGKKVSES